jgi:hypothetical protein
LEDLTFMDSETSTQPPPATRRRRRRIIVFGLIGLAGATVLFWAGIQWAAWRELAGAVAETDRLDPGWRLADLMAARRPIPPATNSATRVLEVAKGIPERWPHSVDLLPKLPEPGSDESEAPATEEPAEILFSVNDVDKVIQKAPPNVALSAETRKSIDRLLEPVEGAIPTARALAGAGEGRYEFTVGEVAIATPSPYIESPRRVYRLLHFDAVRAAEAGRIDEALTAARGMIGVARSIGDEPLELSQLVRVHIRRSAIETIARALGQGEGSDAILAAVQQDLAGEAAHDYFLCAMRAQRAAYFDTLGRMTEGAYARYAEGDFAPAGPGAGRAKANPIAQALYMRAYGRHNQALALSLLNHVVEAAKRRPFDPGWSEHWMAYNQGLEAGGFLRRRLGATAYTILPLNTTMAWLSDESRARSDAMRVLLAAERHRRATSHWPEGMDVLVPTYLPEIPRGPYTDQPLRFVHKDNRILVYALGYGGEDHGGRLHPEHKREPDYDLGEELWDPQLRHQPAPISPPRRAE